VRRNREEVDLRAGIKKILEESGKKSFEE